MLHTRMRWLIVAVALAAMLATTLLAGPALRSTRAASDPPPPYLALGDSVAFGYNSTLVDPSDPHNFSGYPTPAARALKESLTNAACPGETSSHFIDLSGADNGCGAFRANFPLHVAYSGSQLAFADSFLTSHPTTQLVSISIGANDLFLLINKCGGQANVGCIQAGLTAVLTTLETNLSIIYSHIRNADHYHNQLVALTYYSLNYSPANSAANAVIMALNNAIASVTTDPAVGGKVADGYDAFGAIATASFGFAPCAAKLLIVESTSPLTCDIHPSYPGDNGLESHANTGRDVLGQAVVNAVRTD